MGVFSLTKSQLEPKQQGDGNDLEHKRGRYRLGSQSVAWARAPVGQDHRPISQTRTMRLREVK